MAHSLVALLLLRRFVPAQEAVGGALYDVPEVSLTSDLHTGWREGGREGGGMCVSEKVVQYYSTSTVMKLK